MVSRRDTILVVEDDPATRTMLTVYFEDAGYRVHEAADGSELWSTLDRVDVDLVLLDIKLPGEDGLELLRKLRRTSEIAVILVTGKTDQVDRIIGLELGAHDYVTKPFNTRELLARAKNLIRLTRGNQSRLAASEQPGFDGWTLNTSGRRLTSPSGENVPLTRGEFDLLSTFVARPGLVMSRDRLLDLVSHRDGAPNDRTIDVLVGRIRRKIEEDPKRPQRLVTVHGVGYVFTAKVTDTPDLR